MFSFERALKVKYGIWYNAGKFERLEVHENGKTSVYRDDAVASMGRYIANKYWNQYPDLHQFPRLCLSHNAGPERIDQILRTFNFGGLAELCKSHEFVEFFGLSDIAKKFVEAFEKEDKNPFDNLCLIEFASDILCRVRAGDYSEAPGVPRTMCENATEVEFGSVLMGLKARSLQFPTRYPIGAFRKQFEIMQELYPGCEADEQSRKIVVYEGNVFEFLGIPENEELVSEMEPIAVVVPPTLLAPVVGGAQCNAEETQAAIEHVENFMKKDLNKLSPAEKVTAQYGTTEGMLMWNQLSKEFRKKFMGTLEAGEYPPEHVIQTYTKFVNDHVVGELDVVSLLVAGRLVCAKNVWMVKKDSWTKK